MHEFAFSLVLIRKQANSSHGFENRSTGPILDRKFCFDIKSSLILTLSHVPHVIVPASKVNNCQSFDVDACFAVLQVNPGRRIKNKYLRPNQLLRIGMMDWLGFFRKFLEKSDSFLIKSTFFVLN